MSVGERILELRNQRSISQAELARLMSVSRQAVSKWENDLSSPDTLNLIRLADVLDTDVEYLATGRSPVFPAPKPVEKLVEVEKIVEVEKPVEIVRVVEVEKPVERIVEVPVVRKIRRVKYLRNPIEFILLGVLTFIIGLVIGLIL